MDIINAQPDSSTPALKTSAGTMRTRPFFSLKWKAVIALTLLLAAANSGLAYLARINIRQQLDDQLEHSIVRSTATFETLIKQSRIDLQNLSESLLLDVDDGASFKTFAARMQNNWDTIQFNWGIESAAIFDAKGNRLFDFGDNASQRDEDDLPRAVSTSGEPVSAIRCNEHCVLVVATPLLLKNHDLNILEIRTSIADLILNFSRGNADGSALLSKAGVAGDANPWGYRIAAATQREHTSDLLRQAAEKFPASALKQGVCIHTGDHRFYNIYAISIDSREAQHSNTLLVLIDDVTEQHHAIRRSIQQHMISSTIGAFVAEIVLLFILWIPLRRVKQYAEVLPRLALGDFASPAKQQDKLRPRLTHDELDVLDDACLELSQRLQSLSEENELRAQTLEYMALYDHLTGLANRRLFLDHLNNAALEYHRAKDKFAVLFFDLDNFKRVNDSFGHDVGDELLKQVARRLRENTRATDTVARLSGDEFTVLLKHIENNESLLHLVEKIRLALQIPVAVSSSQILVTPSIGIVCAPDNGLEPDQLLRNADVAMYEAKRSGGNGYHFFTEEINRKAVQLLRLESELREALDKHQFFLVYQPLVDLFSMQIVGMEALVRWQHPDNGVTSPGQFISVMENSGMIIEFGAQVIAQACRALAQLQDYKPAFSISVNLSPKQLHDRSLVETLQWQLRSNQVDPRRLKLEITENSLIEDVGENIDVLNQLKEMGLTLSIDDFGTGYSSLSYLKMLPVDELKVDRRFISDITVDRDDREITAAVIAMAHKLQLKVVAEGIETVEQLDFLRRNQCDIGQGFLFAKPLPLEQIKQLLRDGIPTAHYRV